MTVRWPRLKDSRAQWRSRKAGIRWDQQSAIWPNLVWRLATLFLKKERRSGPSGEESLRWDCLKVARRLRSSSWRFSLSADMGKSVVADTGGTPVLRGRVLSI